MSNLHIEHVCRKFLGLPPYNTTSNIVQGDPIYLQSLYEEYGQQQISQMIQQLTN